MNARYLWSAATLSLALHTGCGDDADKTEASSGSGGSGGKGGTTASAGQAATAGSSGASGTSGAGGTPSITDLINMVLTPMCDTSTPSEESCGGTSCPALPDNASTTCTINCCTSDARCGTRSADVRIQQVLGSVCAAPPIPDTRCPTTTLLGQTLVGCCDGQGNCGQVLGATCLPAVTPRACDAPPDTGSDAGM